jgi:hypothetical protein
MPEQSLSREDPYPSDFFTVTSPAYNDLPTNNAVTRGRFYYYRVKTESKSCMVIGPDARPEQNPAGVASVIHEGADNDGGFYVLDLTSCYNRDVTYYKRGIKLNRSSGLITIQDEFILKNNSTVYWLGQSPATDGLSISNGGKTATMVKNGKTFYAFLKSPENAVFEKVDRSESTINYLPETSVIFASIMAGKNSVNKWYGKLQIRFSGTAQSLTTVRVDFSDLSNVTAPDITELINWTTTN